MIAMTIPKSIPPTNEAPSNFLPPVGAGAGGSFVGVDDCGVVLFAVVGVDEVLPGVVGGGVALVAGVLFVPLVGVVL